VLRARQTIALKPPEDLPEFPPVIFKEITFGLVVFETSGFLENIVGLKNDKKSLWSLLKNS